MTLIIIGILALVVAAVGFDLSFTNVLTKDRNDLVFEGKNKKYGAYQMRKSNGWVVGIALLSIGALAT
ncbi:MAG: hypothetical protein ACKVOK_16465, partial [Flavobacteriales bacterium]